MKSILIIIFLFFTLIGNAQSNKKILRKINKFQKDLNLEFLNPKTTILDSLDQLLFNGLDFYPASTKYYIKARFKRTPNEIPFLISPTMLALQRFLLVDGNASTSGVHLKT